MFIILSSVVIAHASRSRLDETVAHVGVELTHAQAVVRVVQRLAVAAVGTSWRS